MFKRAIKFIENNLIFNDRDECYAYFELVPYNYAFLSDTQKELIHNDFDTMVASVQSEKIHALKLATELSVENLQNESKKLVKGELKDVAFNHIDAQTERLHEMQIANQIDYRFFLGFKLTLQNDEVTLKNLYNGIKDAILEFVYTVNHKAFGDFLVKPENELRRFFKAEQFLSSKISRRFEIRSLGKNDMGYIISRINYRDTGFYEDFKYHLPKIEKDGKILLKKYDIEKLGRVMVDPKNRYLEITTDESKIYTTYFAIEEIVDDLPFPHGEMMYYGQLQFDFPIEESITVEKEPHKKAMSTIYNKKKAIEDQENHAYESGSAPPEDVVEKREYAEELEMNVKQFKEDMYKINYLVRISAKTKNELESRADEVVDFYSGFNIKLVRPLGDMMNLQQEFIPANGRMVDDYIQYVRSEFLASLGFGATTQLGERIGMLIGFNRDTGKPVYIRPDLAAQGIKGSFTNALAKLFTGSLGGGKSMTKNLIDYLVTIFGGKTIIIDPKNERGNWKKDLPEIAHAIDNITITSEEKNRGMLDPFVLMGNSSKNSVIEEGDEISAQTLALDVLSYLTGINIHDREDFTLMRRAVKKVAIKEKPGMLKVIDELRDIGCEKALALADHIEAFTDLGFSKLLFSDGEVGNTLSVEKKLTIIQIADLVLPADKKEGESKTEVELLSVAIMIVISTFALDFAHQDRSQFKIFGLEEAWSMLGFSKGKLLIKKLLRMGRALNTGLDLVTQNTSDVDEDGIKNNIGLRFAFRSKDPDEITKVLDFFGLDPLDENNRKTLSTLENGECLFMDLYGRVGVVYIAPMFDHLFKAFDTRPPQEIT